MGKSAAQIKAEIDALKAKLADAEKADQEKREKAILRAAKRAGLFKLDWTPAEFEKAFRQIKDQEKPASEPQQVAPQSESFGGE